MNVKKKLYEWIALVLIYFFIVLVVYVASASAAITNEYYPENQTDVFRYNENLIYKVQTVSMYQDIDYITETINITCYQTFPVSDNMVWHWQKFKGEYNLSNITITGVPSSYTAGNSYLITMRATKDPEANQSAILVYPSFLGFNLYNHTWFNASWEQRIIYNMSNIEYRKVVNMSNGDGVVPYNKSDRWFNYSDNQPLSVFNYTLIGGQVFVHIKGNMNGNTQWVKYVNSTNFYPGVENASLTYNFYENISQTGTFNTTKWLINFPAFLTGAVVDGYLEIDCQAGCTTGRVSVLYGDTNLTQFSNIIYDWSDHVSLGTGGAVHLKDYTVVSYALASAWVRNDNFCYTGTETTSSSSACVIPTARMKSEVNRSPYWNRFYLNDTLLTNKTTDIYNGEQVAMFTPNTPGAPVYIWSVIGYNRSANATFTPFQTLNYSPLNFTSWNNNITNDTSTSINLFVPKTIRTNASLSLNCDNCSWYVNGVPFSNFTLLKDTSLNYSITSSGTYIIGLIAMNNTFSNTIYLNWTITASSPVVAVNIDGFVNNTLGAYVDGVRVDLINTTITGTNRMTYTHTQYLANQTNLGVPTAGHPEGSGERAANVTYWANDSDIQVLVFAHASSVAETAGVFFYVDGEFVAGQSGRPLGAAEQAYREITIDVPRYSSYRVNFTNYHHYEWREYRVIGGYYNFTNVPTGNYTLLFQQVSYNNATSPISLTANMRYNATIIPSTFGTVAMPGFNGIYLIFVIATLFLLKGTGSKCPKCHQKLQSRTDKCRNPKCKG